MEDSWVFGTLFQIVRDVPADLQQGNFADLGVVFGCQETVFGVEQTVLGFTHFDTGQVAKQETLVGDGMVFAGYDKILAFKVE